MKKYTFPGIIILAFSLLAARAHAEKNAFILSSPELKENTPLAAEQYGNNFGCTGSGIAPILEWKNAPKDTKSFAITFYDKDAPTGSGFWHWVAYDIPSTTTKLNPNALPKETIEGNTDAGQPGYLGACPPMGRKHTYVYSIHALKVSKLNVPLSATAAYAGFAIYENTLAKATLSVIAGPR